MYRYSQQSPQNTAAVRLRLRIAAVLLVLLVVATGVFAMRYFSERSKNDLAHQYLMQRVRSCAMDAKALGDKLPSSAASSTAAQLANIRQNVYAIDQLNTLSVQMFGAEGRLVPEEAMYALYQDIDSYYAIMQSNTTSLLETRTLLTTHLAALQAILTE